MRVTLQNLTKKFGATATRTKPTVAVNDFSVTLEDGELISLLGPSGCGKSTILNMLAGIIPVTSGHIFFDDEDVTGLPPERRGIGLVFQNYALYPHMTVLENICFPLEIQRIPLAERRKRALEMANLVHVDELLNRRPKELSGGQQQRVAIARALVKEPRLLLLDEPLSNLDARLRLEMREEIRRIQQQTGVTTIFVTHDQEEAMSISDHIVLMKKGVFQQYDVPQALYDEPANRFVADFLGNPPINHLDGATSGDTFTLTDGSASFRHPIFPKAPDGKAVSLGIRAEAAFDAENGQNGCMTCSVRHVYTMGKEQLTYLTFGTSEWRAYLDADKVRKEGETVRIGLRNRGVFLFDAETGERY